MTDHATVYDFQERTGNPAHASVDRVCERLLDRAAAPRTDHPLRAVGTVEDEVVAAGGEQVHREREVYFANRGFVTTPIVDRHALAVGEVVDGPAILDESGCTSLLPTQTTAEVSEDGNLRVDL